MEAVIREMSSVADRVQLRLFMTHDLPLPDCFNELTEQAMTWGADFIWFVEEDMALPRGILLELTAQDEPIVAADYPVIGSQPTVTEYPNGVTVTGTGCLLVDREVFERLGTPYWQAKAYDTRTWEEVPNYRVEYGLHDADFSKRVHDLGFKTGIIPTRAGQYRLIKSGLDGQNQGTHQIVEWWL